MESLPGCYGQWGGGMTLKVISTEIVPTFSDCGHDSE